MDQTCSPIFHRCLYWDLEIWRPGQHSWTLHHYHGHPDQCVTTKPHIQQGVMHCMVWHIPPITISKIYCDTVALLLVRTRQDIICMHQLPLGAQNPAPVQGLSLLGLLLVDTHHCCPGASPFLRCSDPVIWPQSRFGPCQSWSGLHDCAYENQLFTYRLIYPRCWPILLLWDQQYSIIFMSSVSGHNVFAYLCVYPI